MQQLTQTANCLVKIFHVVVFLVWACAATSAEPDAQVPAEYRLGVGDKIQIDVYDELDLGMTTTIAQSGTIAYPFLGDLTVTGLSLKQVEQLIITGLKGNYLADPQVRVTIVEYRPVFISGEVKQSGGYPYQPGLTVRKAVSLAGGFTAKASSKKIAVIRETGSQKLSIAAELDDLVNPGDTITIGQGFF